MNNLHHSKQDRMAEVMRLTRSGRIAEATALLQRTLGMELRSDEPNAGHSIEAEPVETIDVPYRIIKEDTSSSSTDRDASLQGTDFRSTETTGKVEPWIDLPAGSSGKSPPTVWEKLKNLGRVIKREQRVPKSEKPLSSPRPKGKFIDGAFTNAAGTRTYKLYIPSAYEGQTLPLVVMLHGCTQSSADFAIGTRMNDLAEKDKFFVVYPEQLKSANGSKCWNWFEPANQRRDAGEPSIIAGITQKIMRTYRVDADRVYIGGMSSGGAMSAIMAATYPDIYAAVGVHSGLAYGAAHDLSSGFAAMQKGAPRHKQRLTSVVPLILFHGDRDRTVSKVNADHIRDQWLQGRGNGERPTGGKTIERGQAHGGRSYTRSTYHDKHGRAILEEWIIHHAGHAWSGGSSSGSYTDSKGPDASVEMARFFHEYYKNYKNNDTPN